VPEATATILTEAIRKTVQEPKLQENLKSRGYNIDLRTTPADLNKLVKEEIDKYARFTPQDLGWKAQ
jgi:tripartite-type tricarboxylate transporter receptor subunit TctC